MKAKSLEIPKSPYAKSRTSLAKIHQSVKAEKHWKQKKTNRTKHKSLGQQCSSNKFSMPCWTTGVSGHSLLVCWQDNTHVSLWIHAALVKQVPTWLFLTITKLQQWCWCGWGRTQPKNKTFETLILVFYPQCMCVCVRICTMTNHEGRCVITFSTRYYHLENKAPDWCRRWSCFHLNSTTDQQFSPVKSALYPASVFLDCKVR